MQCPCLRPTSVRSANKDRSGLMAGSIFPKHHGIEVLINSRGWEIGCKSGRSEPVTRPIGCHRANGICAERRQCCDRRLRNRNLCQRPLANQSLALVVLAQECGAVSECQPLPEGFEHLTISTLLPFSAIFFPREWNVASLHQSCPRPPVKGFGVGKHSVVVKKPTCRSLLGRSRIQLMKQFPDVCLILRVG